MPRKKIIPANMGNGTSSTSGQSVAADAVQDVLDILKGQDVPVTLPLLSALVGWGEGLAKEVEGLQKVPPGWGSTATPPMPPAHDGMTG